MKSSSVSLAIATGIVLSGTGAAPAFAQKAAAPYELSVFAAAPKGSARPILSRCFTTVFSWATETEICRMARMARARRSSSTQWMAAFDTPTRSRATMTA